MSFAKNRQRLRAASKDPFWKLVAIAKILNGPGGCPWDQVQSVRSVLPYLVEEAWEVFVSVKRQRKADLEEELGDVLYTAVFLALLAEREGWCSLTSILARTAEKMERRHPHVFHGKPADTPEAAYRLWQQAKRRENDTSSSSKRLRPLLVALWDALLEHQRASSLLKRTLKTISGSRRKISERARAIERPTKPPSRALSQGARRKVLDSVSES